MIKVFLRKLYLWIWIFNGAVFNTYFVDDLQYKLCRNLKDKIFDNSKLQTTFAASYNCEINNRTANFLQLCQLCKSRVAISSKRDESSYSLFLLEFVKIWICVKNLRSWNKLNFASCFLEFCKRRKLHTLCDHHFSCLERCSCVSTVRKPKTKKHQRKNGPKAR